MQQTLQANGGTMASRLRGDEDGVAARANPLAVQYDFYLTKALKNDENVMALLTTLREAGPRDRVVIHLNCPGGLVSTTAQIITAIRDTDAHVTTSAEGEVASGASAIFFAGHSFVVSDLALFMLHSANGGAGGNLGDAINQLQATQEWVSKIYKSTYIPFFTEAEVDAILNGKEVWLDAVEVSGRIDRVQKDIHDNRVR